MVRAMQGVSQSTLRDLNVERSTVSRWESGVYAITATAFKLLSRRLDLCNSSLILGEGACCERHERKLREHHQTSVELLGVSLSGKLRGRHLY
jgi:transcriptional regulator with XRE-family HTH domain